MSERAFDELLEHYRWRFGVEDPALLDWTGSMRVRPRITDAPVRDERPDAPARNSVVFGPAGDRLAHPDRGVQIVVLGEAHSAAALAEARRVARDAVVVWAHDGGVTVEWLRPGRAGRPEVTLLVPTADAPEELDACLSAIAATTPAVPAVEVVVSDAGTTDAGAAVVADWSERLSLRHGPADPARGPLNAINPGAQGARGELLVIVGERTRVRTGWLRPLVRALREAPDVGVAGGLLLAADGTVEAAGGALFADASATGFGRGATDPRDPLLRQDRDVPFVSAGLLATRRGLLLRLGGVDSGFGPLHAAVDYCLRVEAAGRRVVHRPQSVAEVAATPPGADEDDGRRRFARRWTTRLATLPPRPEQLDAVAWHRLARSA